MGEWVLKPCVYGWRLDESQSSWKLITILSMAKDNSRTGLVVFSDDWGRHPSSCQHLMMHLFERYRVLWVNTIGTRRPGLSIEDIGKMTGRISLWLRMTEQSDAMSENLRVVSPKMYPGFRRQWQRKLNLRLLAKQLDRAMDEWFGKSVDHRIAITTIPITADLIGRLHVDRWVYYCVDDFSAWPGLDRDVMEVMEREQVDRVDSLIAVSQTLSDRLHQMGRESTVLTHGIDLDHWREQINISDGTFAWMKKAARPLVMFWGLIDRRLDTAWCRALLERLKASGGTLVLVGPQQSPDPQLTRLIHSYPLVLPGSVHYFLLPTLVKSASVLVMPYEDSTVTRAMQPLKLKEYLATGKPVVVRDLPSTTTWRDCCDVVDDIDRFVSITLERALSGILPADQAAGRERLASETWSEKARHFESIVCSARK